MCLDLGPWARVAALIPAVTELASGCLANRKEKVVVKQRLAIAKIEAQVTSAGLTRQPLLHRPSPFYAHNRRLLVVAKAV